MNKTKIYLGDGIEEYNVQKDKYGTPYVTIGEIIESLNCDDRYDAELDLAKEIIKDLSVNQDDDRIGYVAIAAIDALIKNVDDPAVKAIAKGLNIILKDIYD